MKTKKLLDERKKAFQRYAPSIYDNTSETTNPTIWSGNWGTWSSSWPLYRYQMSELLRQIPGCPWVSHLLYADDTIIFTNGSLNSLSKFMSFLKVYENMSGQQINKNKSCFLASAKVPPIRIELIKRRTGFQSAAEVIKYLASVFWPLKNGILLWLAGQNQIQDCRLAGEASVFWQKDYTTCLAQYHWISCQL